MSNNKSKDFLYTNKEFEILEHKLQELTRRNHTIQEEIEALKEAYHIDNHHKKGDSD